MIAMMLMRVITITNIHLHHFLGFLITVSHEYHHVSLITIHHRIDQPVFITGDRERNCVAPCRCLELIDPPGKKIWPLSPDAMLPMHQMHQMPQMPMYLAAPAFCKEDTGNGGTGCGSRL